MTKTVRARIDFVQVDNEGCRIGIVILFGGDRSDLYEDVWFTLVTTAGLLEVIDLVGQEAMVEVELIVADDLSVRRVLRSIKAV